MIMKNVPLSRPDITDADIDAVVDVMRTPHLSLGPKVPEFEAAMCDYTGARYATAVNSGTSALHLAVIALGIGAGDEVITSPFSFVASANCILFERATPIFADIDRRTLNLDPSAVERAITPRTKAILPVHVFGVPANMDAMLDIAKRHGLAVIEDSCEALGATWRGRACGTLGNAGTFAFYPNKQMTTGEGGMIITDDAELDGLAKSLRNQGRGTSGAWLQHERMGFNYRLADINCALGVSQLSRITEILEARRDVAATYKRHLGRLDGVELPVDTLDGAEISWFVYVIRLRQADRAQRDAFMEHLRSRGVACANYFSPIHLQPYFQRMGHRPGEFPVTEAIADTTVALPFFNQLTESDIEYVASVVEEALHGIAQAPAYSVRRSVL